MLYEIPNKHAAYFSGAILSKRPCQNEKNSTTFEVSPNSGKKGPETVFCSKM